MNLSLPLNTPCEIINITPFNPLISKCQIKVCYVGEEPNRNGSIITEEVARELANSLPGSPIVGYYNENIGDFEGHNRILEIKNGKVEMKDTTRPYGFVDLGAKVWFQEFMDNGIIHKYLMTEGWLWTGQYPEAQRIIDEGNNQSMELDEKLTRGHWTKDTNDEFKFFIINEAIISKLCVLGENTEPCFEGAQITSFSLNEDFAKSLFSLVEQMKEILEKGGTPMPTIDPNVVEEPIVDEGTPVVEEPVVEEPVAAEPDTEPVVEEPVVEEPVVEEPVVEEPAAPTYSLEEIPEYVELNTRYTELETSFAALSQEKETLTAELEQLRNFKLSVERKEKESMINSFYMLSDEDKKDVVENIDKYSIDDIEAKLSIICVRNKVNFNLEEPNNKVEPTVYNLGEGAGIEEDVVPAWVKAIQAVANNK